AIQSRYGTSSAIRRSFGQMTPVGAWRSTSSRASTRSRAAGNMTGTPSGTGASSSTRTKRSSTMRPALTSGIDALLEWLDAETLDGIDEKLLRPLAQLEIGGRDVFDHIRDLVIGNGRTENLAELGALVGAAADGHLIIFLAVLLDAQDANVTDVMMAARVMQPEMLMCSRPRLCARSRSLNRRVIS